MQTVSAKIEKMKSEENKLICKIRKNFGKSEFSISGIYCVPVSGRKTSDKENKSIKKKNY